MTPCGCAEPPSGSDQGAGVLSVEPIEPNRCVLDVRSSTPLQLYDWGIATWSR